MLLSALQALRKEELTGLRNKSVCIHDSCFVLSPGRLDFLRSNRKRAGSLCEKRLSKQLWRPSCLPRGQIARCCQENDLHSDRKTVETKTMAWVRIIVCGLRLCPFAQAVLDDGLVRFAVHGATEEAQVAEAFIEEIELLKRTPPLEVATTLLILPRFASKDFLQFQNFCESLEHYIDSDDVLADEVMLACFHPLHNWQDADSPDAPVNFDKRAPFPIINLLRTEQVDNYIAQGKTQDILERNRVTLEEMGAERLRDLYRSLFESADLKT